MGLTGLRIFYRKQDGKSVWTHELRGGGEFPMSQEQDLASVPDREGVGSVADYGCYETFDPYEAETALVSDSNRVVDGVLTVGPPRPTRIPASPRNLEAEIDALTTRFDTERPGGEPE